MTRPGSLSALLNAGHFVVTAEVTPPLAAGADPLLAKAMPLKGLADAVNVTDGAGARVALSSVAAAAILARDGIEPVLQVTCRDRNRIALAADLLGAAALGVGNLLVLRGDDPKGGDHPDAKPVFDLESKDVIALARQMSDDGVLPSGRKIEPPPGFFIGAADTPLDPPADWRPDGLLAKAGAGADFVQTQFCFDPAVAGRYLARLVDSGLTERLKIILGVGPIASARSARWMNDNLFGVNVPDKVVARLAQASDPAAEGRRFCAELIQALLEIPGLAGVHIMAPQQRSDAIVEVIEQSGILRNRRKR